MNSADDTTDDLESMRARLGISQATFAGLMDMPLRTYQDLAAGKAISRPVHLKAAERAALTYAVQSGNPMLAPASIRKEALELARLMVS